LRDSSYFGENAFLLDRRLGDLTAKSENRRRFVLRQTMNESVNIASVCRLDAAGD